MYKIRVIQKTGHISTESFLNMDIALDRFNKLKAKKEKYCLEMQIFLEESVHMASEEFRVHRIG